jgi:hypothetical protein
VLPVGTDSLTGLVGLAGDALDLVLGEMAVLSIAKPVPTISPARSLSESSTMALTAG